MNDINRDFRTKYLRKDFFLDFDFVVGFFLILVFLFDGSKKIRPPSNRFLRSQLTKSVYVH